MPRSVLMAHGSGGRIRGRQSLGLVDGVKVSLGWRVMTWRLSDNARKIRRSEESLWFLCSFEPPSSALTV